MQLRANVLVRNREGTCQLVVPFTLRRRLFEHTHAGPLSAHLGTERTLAQLRQAYYWPSMRKDVANWYKLCSHCAQSRGPLSHSQGKLVKVMTGAPLDIVAIDILSGLPTAPDGSKHLLVITDYFSKWVEACPLVETDAATCMNAMYVNFFSHSGLPRQLHSDQGRNFESKLFQELCRLTGINKTRTTPFHARSDGQTERMNRTILQMLRTSASDNPSDWPSKLPSLLAAYRMTVHSTTGVSPNFAMFGREVLLPAYLIAKPPDEPVDISVPFVETFQSNIRSAHERVRQATQSAAKTQKTYFDKLVRGPPFAVHQLVWLFWPQPTLRQKHGKLQRLWTGPWKILSFRSPVVVVIQNCKNNKKQTVHIDRLSPCLSSSLDTTVSTDNNTITSQADATLPDDGSSFDPTTHSSHTAHTNFSHALSTSSTFTSTTTLSD